jgi:hypothetical protein
MIFPKLQKIIVQNLFFINLKYQNEYKKQAVAHSDFQLTLDQKTHENLLNNRVTQNRYDYDVNNKFDDKPLVSLTNNHFYINHTPQERLTLYNYSLEQFKNSGYPIDSKWNDETFLNYDTKYKSDPNTKNKG